MVANNNKFFKRDPNYVSLNLSEQQRILRNLERKGDMSSSKKDKDTEEPLSETRR